MSSKKGMHWLNDGKAHGGKGAIPQPVEEEELKDKKSKRNKAVGESQIDSTSKQKVAVR